MVHTVLMKLRLSCDMSGGTLDPIQKYHDKNWQILKYHVENWQNTNTVFLTGHTYLKLHLSRVMTFCIVSGAEKYMYINFWIFFATYSVLNDEI